MTTYQMIEQSDNTDQFGQVYVTFANNIDKAVASVASPQSGTGGSAAWVSGAKVATVKILKPDGTALANHACIVTVLAGNG
jgi:hypothetical protein